MEQKILWLVVVALSIGFVVLAIMLLRRMPKRTDESAHFLKADITELARTVADLQSSMSEKIEENNVRMHSSLRQQLAHSSKIVSDVSARLTKLDETNRRVVDVADELKTLQNVLQNPKQRGVFGEYYLESVLDNVLPAKQYQMQYKFRDGEIVDAVIFLEKGQVLPIDSKFSLENYNRMVDAADKAQKDAYLLKVRADLKKRIDETSKYIRPDEDTMDFAFMFIPSEALYYDLLVGGVGSGASTRDLIEYAFRDKRVIIVSPTSFMAYLQTVLQGLRSLQIEQQAKDIQVRVGQLGRHIAMHEQLMQKLGNSLGVTVNHFNNAHNELKKIDKDVVKIADGDSVVEPLVIDRPQ